MFHTRIPRKNKEKRIKEKRTRKKKLQFPPPHRRILLSQKKYTTAVKHRHAQWDERGKMEEKRMARPAHTEKSRKNMKKKKKKKKKKPVVAAHRQSQKK
jgi:hypothetical protein